jgi:GAF domain-containing protein
MDTYNHVRLSPEEVCESLSLPGRAEAIHVIVSTTLGETFDLIARVASRLLKAPVSQVSLVTEDRQVFVGQHGMQEPYLTMPVTPLSHSFCQYVVATGLPMVVSDARNSSLCDNLSTKELGVAAYMGVPLAASESLRLGALCVIDHHPREWTSDELDTLTELSLALNELLRVRLALQAQREYSTGLESSLQKSRKSLLALLDESPLPRPLDPTAVGSTLGGGTRLDQTEAGLTTVALIHHLARFESASSPP